MKINPFIFLVFSGLQGFCQIQDGHTAKESLALDKIPFIERVVPGLSFQIQNSGSFVVDANPMVLYRFTPRFTAGGGWNFRLAYGHGRSRGHGSGRINGPRLAFQYSLRKGFSIRMLPEMMSTPSQPYYATPGDPRHQIWVGGLFLGLKKDFRIVKGIHGNVEGLFNLAGTNTNVYADRFALRFGFEFQLKKKVKVASH